MRDRVCMACVALTFVATTLLAGDVNVHHGTGNVSGVYSERNTLTGAVIKAEVFVATKYPGTSAFIISYDCHDARDTAVTSLCLSINPSTDNPTLLDGCTDVSHFHSSAGGVDVDGWACDEGFGSCFNTWSELPNLSVDTSTFPNIQAANVLDSSYCTTK